VRWIVASLAPGTSMRSNRASASILRPGPPSARCHVVGNSLAKGLSTAVGRGMISESEASDILDFMDEA
jgi:hypothetical protein